MVLRRIFKTTCITIWMFFINSYVWAQRSGSNTADPLEATNDFSEKVLSIVQGPLLKIMAAVVLMVGVAGLLRGKHKLAISCGAAFLLLLFLPILLGKV